MNELQTLFITVTTYGTWLPGDERGWRKRGSGNLDPQPRLAVWCRNRMSEDALILTSGQREKVEEVFYEHAKKRGWQIHACSVRTNHFHIAVAVGSNIDPKKVQDQFKANATRVLRQLPEPIDSEKVWTKGGDIEFVNDNAESLDKIVLYINEAQDRMHLEK